MKNPDTAITSTRNSQIKTVERWLKDVVIGLNLCPFAAKPFGDKRIRIEVFEGDTEAGLLEMLQSELTLMDERPIENQPPEETETVIETTLIVIPNMLHNFDTYNQFLDLVDALLD
ncbi:MAG: DUF1415 family protein, partial [Gammaproteobacteria bacterium]|nr:DUF1415 family protein [Gammaproteobacteria bacterium]